MAGRLAKRLSLATRFVSTSTNGRMTGPGAFAWLRRFAPQHLNMSSAENRQHTSPGVPPPFSADDHESRDYYAGQNAPQPPPNQAPYLTPYLGLRARLSQIWINRWTILLLLVLIRTLFAIGSIDDGLESARVKAISACQDTEKVGSALASAPYYISKGLNTMTATGVEKAVNGMMSLVRMAVSAVEEIVVFVIGMLTNTYLCLITLIVRGSMQAAIELLQKANDELKGMTEKIGNGLGDAVKLGQDGINKIANGIGSLTGQKVPTLDFTKQINEIKDISLPGGLTDDLQKLNNSIPTFDQVRNATESVIRLPFEKLKELIAREMGNYTFNGTILPLAARDTVSFCAGPDGVGINEVFDSLVHAAKVARTVFLVVLLVAAVLVCVPMAWIEIKKWRRQQEHARLLGDEAMDKMDGVYIVSRPWTSRVGIRLSKRFRSSRAQVLARWAVAYPTSVPALFVLSLALAGLFACLCQYILLKTIENESPAITQKLADGAGKVVAALNDASNKWSIDTNKAIAAENQKLNDDLFGWVTTSTVAVNDTLNTFVDEVHDLAEKFLGGTALQKPLEELFRCLIGLKVESFQKGLTWVKENANISFPLMKNDTLSLAAMADLTDSSSDDNLLKDPTGTAQAAINRAVQSMIRKLMSGVRQEAIISTCILLIWVLMVVIGITQAYFSYLRGDKLRAEGGNEYDFSDSGHTPNVQDRPESAAPPYRSPEVDANSYAPYTLNVHPFPAQANPPSASHDEGLYEKGGLQNGVGNFSRPTTANKYGGYQNEKAGGDSFADDNRI